VVVLGGLLALGAGRFLALRVEVAPLRAEGVGTVVEVVVQVAPEDRARVGRTAWLQGALTRGETTVVRLARGVDLDEQGRVRLEMVLEPGTYGLRVELKSGQGQGTGLWQGTVEVPRVEPGAALPQAAAPVVAGAATAPTPGPSGSVASAEPPPEPRSEAPAEGEPEAAAGAGRTEEAADSTRAAAQPAASPAPSPTEVAGAPAAAAPVAVAATSGTAPRGVEPPSASGTAARIETPAVAEAAGVLPPASAPAAVAPPVERAPTPRPGVPPQDLERWGSVQPGVVDLTVWVNDRGRPVRGLDRGAFRVELDGDPTALTDFGDATRVPLVLGVVAHVASETLVDLPALEGLLGRLAVQASDGRGSVYAVSASEQGASGRWDATADETAALLRPEAGSGRADLAQAVVAALDGLGHRSGRRVLVVVVDGGDSSERSGWRAAADAAEDAGIPVLVVGVEGGRLESSTRRGLERVVDASGGVAYFPRPTDAGLLELVSDLYADIVATTYDLRLPRPASGDTVKVKVEVLGGGTEVRHSRRIR